LRLFDNRAIKIILGPKRMEERWEWKKVYNEEINKRYSSPNIFRFIKAGHVARMWDRRTGYRVLVGKFEGKKIESP
jgi:hypothetical protein